MSETMQGPPLNPYERIERREELKKRTRLDLWKAVWEASQVMTYQEILDFTESVCDEIQSDEP